MKLSTLFKRAAKLVESEPEAPHYSYAMSFAASAAGDYAAIGRAKRAAEEFFGDECMPREDSDVRVIAFGFLAAIAESEGK